MAKGKVVIETILETKKFDKQIDEVDKQVQELERKL